MVAKPEHPGGTPRVSVVMPVFESQHTLARSLESVLAQSYTDFELIAVDSSPGEASSEVLRRYPSVRTIRSRRRLLPQLARQAGVEAARGSLLVSVDPDVYAHRDWLGKLVAAHDAHHGPAIVGALACHGRRWLDLGVHLCKFSKWLPGRTARRVDVGPSANLLVDREAFAEAGGFSGDDFFGDATLSWTLGGELHGLAFAADAVVDHHHLSSFGGFLAERYRRGVEFALLRLSWQGARRATAAWYLAITVLPIRLCSNLVHVYRHASEAGWRGELLRTAPVVALGVAATMAGEAIGYARALVKPPTAAWVEARSVRSR